MRAGTKVVVVTVVAAVAAGGAYLLMRRRSAPVILQADPNGPMTWTKTSEGLLLKNNDYSSHRRFWIRGEDAGENTVVASIKVVSGNLGVDIEANYSYGAYLHVGEGQTITFTSEKSNIYDPPNKTIPATPGSPFARVNGADINFWVCPGGQVLFIEGQINSRKISLTEAQYPS